MNTWTLALCLFVIGAVCAVIGWAVGYKKAEGKYYLRLKEQHYQILDLNRELDKQIDMAHDLYLESQAEMKRMGVE
jgi:hypothetical protein